MREFDPNDPSQRNELREVREEGGLAIIGVAAVLALAIAAGVYFFMTGDRSSTTAMNTAARMTSGASTSTLPPPPAPPAKEPAPTR